MHGLDTSNVSSRVESSQVEFEPMSTVCGISEITGYVCVVHGGRVLATDLNSRLDSSFKRLFLKM